MSRVSDWRGVQRSGQVLKYSPAVAIGLVIFGQQLMAASWDVSPHLDLAEVYTSNVTLAPSSEEEEFITRITPGVSVIGQGSGLKLDLKYRLEQNLYASESSRNDTFHQLSGRADAEIVRDTLFMDAVVRVGQTVIDGEKSISLDNLNLGNKADVTTFSAGPVLKHDFNGFVLMDLSYHYETVDYEATNTISDAKIDRFEASLESGRRLTRFTWQGHFESTDTERDSAAGSKRKSALLALQYQMFRSLALIARTGYEKNDIPTTRNTVVDGSYWSAGFKWRPSVHFAVDSSYGDHYKDANIDLSPTSRTSLQIGYRDREVGINVGSTWTAKFNLRTRRTKWQAGYLEDVTNVQILQFEGLQVVSFVDDQGNAIIDPQTGLPVIAVINTFGLTDEEFLRKRSNFSVTLSTARSQINLSVYQETRRYEVSQKLGDIHGGAIGWNWQFASKTKSNISIDRQTRRFSTSASENDLWHVTVGVYTKLKPHVTAFTELWHILNESSLTANEYRENRVVAGIKADF